MATHVRHQNMHSPSKKWSKRCPSLHCRATHHPASWSYAWIQEVRLTAPPVLHHQVAKVFPCYHLTPWYLSCLSIFLYCMCGSNCFQIFFLLFQWWTSVLSAMTRPSLSLVATTSLRQQSHRNMYLTWKRTRNTNNCVRQFTIIIVLPRHWNSMTSIFMTPLSALRFETYLWEDWTALYKGACDAVVVAQVLQLSQKLTIYIVSTSHNKYIHIALDSCS